MITALTILSSFAIWIYFSITDNRPILITNLWLFNMLKLTRRYYLGFVLVNKGKDPLQTNRYQGNGVNHGSAQNRLLETTNQHFRKTLNQFENDQ